MRTGVEDEVRRLAELLMVRPLATNIATHCPRRAYCPPYVYLFGLAIANV